MHNKIKIMMRCAKKRKIIIILFIILIAYLSLNILLKIKKNSVNKEEISIQTFNKISKFEAAGFNEDEEKLIVSKLDQKQIDLIFEKKYNKDMVLSLLKEKYFIKNNLERYFNFYQQYNTKNISEIIKDVNANIDYEFYTEQVPSDTSKGILMIANKHYALSENFMGLDIVEMDFKYSFYDYVYSLNKEAYEQFEKMWNDAKKNGLDFAVYSAYRSYNVQKNLYNGYVNKDGKEGADTYSARPGNSEHQLGLAVDLKSRTMNTDYFEKTNEYKWLKENSYKYGFIERYELGQEYITGYQYEPWHFRYCGIDCATYIFNNKITFEEYYEFFVKEK